MRPQAEDLDRLRCLLPQSTPPGKTSQWVVVWLDDPPWAPSASLPADASRPESGDYVVIPSAGPITPEQEIVMAPEEAEAVAQKMWQQREDLSDLDADVLDAISAAWLRRGPRSAAERVPVYVDDLLLSRGLKPKKGGQGRRGGFEPEQHADLWRCLLHLQDLWLDIAEVTVVDQDARGQRRRRTRALQSRAFLMTDRIGQRRLDGTMDVEAILVTPGEAFGRFLLGPGRQLALLSSEALRYDPYRQRTGRPPLAACVRERVGQGG